MRQTPVCQRLKRTATRLTMESPTPIVLPDASRHDTGAAMTFGDWLTTTLFPFLLAILPIGLWMAFWLWAVNWKMVWPVLAEGAWMPCVLLGLIIAPSARTGQT